MLRKLEDFNRDTLQDEENIRKFRKFLDDEYALMDYLCKWRESYEAFDHDEVPAWKVLEDLNPFLTSKDLCEYEDAITEAKGLWNTTDKGYDGYMMRSIWQSIDELCEKIWIFGYGRNHFYNCLLQKLDILIDYEREDNLADCVFVIRNMPFIRARVGFHMLKMGLL